MYKELTKRKHKEDGSEDRQPWEEHGETVQTSRDEVRKPKAQSAIKSNKKGFHKYTGDKRQARENAYLPLNNGGRPITQDIKKAEELKAQSLLQRLVSRNRDSRRQKGKTAACSKEADQGREHLSKQNAYFLWP